MITQYNIYIAFYCINVTTDGTEHTSVMYKLQEVLPGKQNHLANILPCFDAQRNKILGNQSMILYDQIVQN